MFLEIDNEMIIQGVRSTDMLAIELRDLLQRVNPDFNYPIQVWDVI